MVDPITSIGAGLSILGSKDIITKLLGPTAEYIGGEIKGLVEKCNVNLDDIFVKAHQKLGNKLDQPGVVNPRVLKSIFDEGRFCEDELTKEYFGGVLASSRTENGKDDRGITNSKLVSSLSSYQLRTHYIFYSLLRKTFQPYRHIVSPGTSRQMMPIYLPTELFYMLMNIIEEYPDPNERLNILTHSMNGLRRADLIEDNYLFGGPEFFKRDNIKCRFDDFPMREEILCEHGITFQPTPGGMELFLWAHGLGQFTHFQFLDENLKIEEFPNMELPDKVDILYEDFIIHLQENISGQPIS